MNNKKFFLAALVTTILAFVLNSIVYVVFLKDFFHTHPAVSEAFASQLYRPDDQIIWWAVILSAAGLGLMVTTVIQWSGAHNLATGLKSGFVFAFLLLCTVDFGLLASTNNFTVSGALADLACSTATVSISGGVAGWILGKGLPAKN